ncbi:hypothetical protein [Micromonospora echinospora]|uniref:hypothetical protein n=1 Tax=Micromonospora echinospora TaxID=1877 RepID=UPI00366ADDDD
MANILRRPRVRGLVAAAVIGGGLVLGTAAPAHANYVSPSYPTKLKCEAARPAYKTSWTTPGPCIKITSTSYKFIVYTNY